MKIIQLVLLLLLASSFACNEDNDFSKGAEEQALTGGKSDTFFLPTPHGELVFGVPAEAKIQSSARFHEWTFSLSASASVVLETEVADGLDSVLYLYGREKGGKSWGKYKKKNDDFDDSGSSKVIYEAPAGEYRIIVKAFKKDMEGAFKMKSTCEGSGCKKSEVLSCQEEVFGSLPARTAFTDQCSSKIIEHFDSAIFEVQSGEVLFKGHCAESDIVQKAIGHYVSFWEERGDINDLLGDDIEFSYVLRELVNEGFTVEIDAGGDEDSLTLFYDPKGDLILAFQDSQSPTVDYFCGLSSEESQDGPDGECFENLITTLPWEEDALEMIDEEGRVADILALNQKGATLAIEDFQELYKDRLKSSDTISYGVETFDGGSEVDLSASTDSGFIHAFYTFVDDEFNAILVRESRVGNQVFCGI